jgi:hypothetical protein
MAKKKFRLTPDQIKPLVRGFGGCIATDHITVGGAKVGVMTRDEPSREEDSGWSFLAGDESQEYLDDADNSGVYEVNTIANYDRDILPFLYAEPGSTFVRGKEGRFEAEGVLPPVPVRRLTKEWSLELNSCFRSRVEEESLVCVAPARTIWISSFEAKPGESSEERLRWIKKEANPRPVERWEPAHPSLKRYAYLLLESDDEKAARWGFCATTVAPTGAHLWQAFYFDFKEDLDWARRTWDSVVFTPIPGR